MSDEQQWKPPVFAGGSGATDAPFIAPGTPPVEPTPVYGPPPTQPVGSWTAPPKPGLIPLRPLTLGTILSASFQVLRRNPRPTVGYALAVQSLIMLVALALVGLVSFAAISRVVTASTEDTDEVGAGAVVLIVLSTLVPGILSMVALALVQGILMLEIQRATLGEKLKLRQLWQRARGRLGALVGWMLIVTAAVLAALAVLVAFIVLLAALGSVGIALAVVVGIFGGGAMLAASVWLGTKLSLVPSVLMGERLTLRESLSRSWSLTNGYFWRTFGIQLLVSTILSVAMQVITVPVQLLAPMTMFIIDPNGTGSPVAVIVMIGLSVVSIIVVLALSSIALVVQSATTGLIYIDLRMRKEGLDLDLARFVEERAAGHNPSDPYQTASGSRATQPMPPQGASPWA